MSRALVALYITICSVLFLLSKMLISFLLYKKWARKKRIIDNSLAGGKMVIFRSATMAMPQSLTPKSFLAMLMGLSTKDVIGAGGYGTVYRLRLDDKTAFAVKRLNRGTAEMDRGFERELDAMGDIKHRNIVPLCGYYAATHFNLLIYELMPNGSLDQALHHANQFLLDWPARYRIALGVARGLSYLHHDCIPHVIHRDIKSSNILLDHHMEARLSDFGLATLMNPSASHHHPRRRHLRLPGARVLRHRQGHHQGRRLQLRRRPAGAAHGEEAHRRVLPGERHQARHLGQGDHGGEAGGARHGRGSAEAAPPITHRGSQVGLLRRRQVPRL
jgi:hypothetical protein